MAILINSARGQGYMACMDGQPRDTNPYLGPDADSICQWYEWNLGWNQAWDEARLGAAA